VPAAASSAWSETSQARISSSLWSMLMSFIALFLSFASCAGKSPGQDEKFVLNPPATCPLNHRLRWV
jgi:hypothetical protein